MSLKITDLKVAELRAELEKRGLDKSGIKTVLIERLRNALKDEGIDADEYEFNNKSELSNSEIGEEEEMDTVENAKETSKEDEDVLCCDDEELDDFKQKEDTESGRFKTVPQPRSEVPVIELDASNGPVPDSESKDENVSEAEPSKETQNEAESTETSDSNDTKSKNKVVKVVGKDKVQQLTVTARTLWVTGIPSTSKVSELKNFFSKHGKVTSVKIVRSTKGTQRKWYGLLTMATSKDASKCIEKLHRTEFNGHVISVERRQTAPIVKKSEAAAVKKTSLKGDSKDSAGKSEKDSKKSEDDKHKDSKEDDEKDKSGDERGSPDRRRHRSYESRSYFRGRYSRAPFRRPMGGYRGRGMSFRGRGRFMGFRRPFGRSSHFEPPSFRSYSSRGRYRSYDDYEGRGSRYPSEREMRMKQEEEMYRHKIIIRKQKEESYRLEREKNQLRLEREMLEREKAEMLKLERAKQRMEREQLELEREKLRRQAQMSHPIKRPFSSRGGGPPNWAEKRRESDMDGSSHGFPPRKKFAPESKFQYQREHSAYKKPDFMHHEEFRREKMDMPPHPKFGERDERREVTYHGAPERRVYSRSDFRGPGPSTSPPMKHYPPRSKPREDWKFHERRSTEKPGYAPRGRKMGFYQ